MYLLVRVQRVTTLINENIVSQRASWLQHRTPHWHRFVSFGCKQLFEFYLSFGHFSFHLYFPTSPTRTILCQCLEQSINAVVLKSKQPSKTTYILYTAVVAMDAQGRCPARLQYRSTNRLTNLCRFQVVVIGMNANIRGSPHTQEGHSHLAIQSIQENVRSTQMQSFLRSTT